MRKHEAVATIKAALIIFQRVTLPNSHVSFWRTALRTEEDWLVKVIDEFPTCFISSYCVGCQKNESWMNGRVLDPKLCSLKKSIEHFILSFITERGKSYKKKAPKGLSMHKKRIMNAKSQLFRKYPPQKIETFIHLLKSSLK